MMMHFKCCVFFLLLGLTALAVDPISVFQKNRDAILAGKISNSEECFFGIGRASVRGRSSLSKEIAAKKAIFLAEGDLLTNIMLAKILWPNDWSAERIERVRIFAKQRGNFSARAKMRGMVTLHQQTMTNQVRFAVVGVHGSGVTILALPQPEQIERELKKWERLREEKIRRERKKKDGGVNSSPLKEPGNLLTNVVQSISDVTTNESPTVKNSLLETKKTLAPRDLGNGVKVLMDFSEEDDLLF